MIGLGVVGNDGGGGAIEINNTTAYSEWNRLLEIFTLIKDNLRSNGGYLTSWQIDRILDRLHDLQPSFSSHFPQYAAAFDSLIDLVNRSR